MKKLSLKNHLLNLRDGSNLMMLGCLVLAPACDDTQQQIVSDLDLELQSDSDSYALQSDLDEDSNLSETPSETNGGPLELESNEPSHHERSWTMGLRYETLVYGEIVWDVFYEGHVYKDLYYKVCIKKGDDLLNCWILSRKFRKPHNRRIGRRNGLSRSHKSEIHCAE